MKFCVYCAEVEKKKVKATHDLGNDPLCKRCFKRVSLVLGVLRR